MSKQTGPGPTGPGPQQVTLEQLMGTTPAIALSGGASLGDFEVGAVRYLYDQGVRPKILCGTSVGSINALKLAEGEAPATGAQPAGWVPGLAGLEGIWRSLKRASQMWLPDALFLDLANRLPKVEAEFNKLQTDGAALQAAKANVHFDFFNLFESADELAIAMNLAVRTLEDLPAIGEDLSKLIEDLSSAVSLANLDPIAKTMKLPASLQPSRLKTSGIKLRMVTVALEDGKLRYFDENGTLLERDGTPSQPIIRSPQCADPLLKKLNDLQDKLDKLRDQTGDLDSKGKPIIGGSALNKLLNDRKNLESQMAPLWKALAACPLIPGPEVKVDLVDGAIASSSIPVIFPPKVIEGYHYVDGGIRMLIPFEPAIQEGATMVFGIEAGSPKMDVKTISPPFEFLDIALRTGAEIEPDEIGRRDRLPPMGFPVPAIVIVPYDNTHTGFDIDPGLINIRMAYGFMRANDTVDAYFQVLNQTQPVALAQSKDPYYYQTVADQNSARRKTLEIVNLRRSIWEKEFPANGKEYIPGSAFPPTAATFKDTGKPDAAAEAQVRAMKQQLATMVADRITKHGGKMPAGYEGWSKDWESHDWTAAHPF